jgi:hypothetical protein
VVRDPFEVGEGSTGAHRGLTTAVDQGGGEGGLPMVGVDSSRFRKVAEAKADDEVVAVGVGHGLRQLPPVTPP